MFPSTDAQRTEESIEDVPIAVTALTGAMMEERGIITPSDLQMSMPAMIAGRYSRDSGLVDP